MFLLVTGACGVGKLTVRQASASALAPARHTVGLMDVVGRPTVVDTVGETGLRHR